MKTFNYKDLSKKQQYKYLTGSIIPRPIAWVSTISKNNIVNLAPFSYFNIIAKEVPLVSISILRDNGLMKDTVLNILENKEAVIHIVTEELIDEMNMTSINLPYEESEVELTNLTLVNSDIVKVPKISEAKIQLESKLYEHIEIKDEEGIVITDLLILKVILFHFDDAVIDEEKGYILVDKLKPVARLSGNNYATIKDNEKTIERPKVK